MESTVSATSLQMAQRIPSNIATTAAIAGFQHITSKNPTTIPISWFHILNYRIVGDALTPDSSLWCDKAS